MKTSGLVLDIHDDFQGEVLRSIYPSETDIPESVKVAHALTVDERQRLPDSSYALVLVNNGEKFRKYACIDAGNTTLAVEFFLKTAHKLPEEAQKVAAENLLRACEMYQVSVPEELKKHAFVGALLNAIPAIEAGAAVPGQVRQRLQENQILGQGGHVISPEERLQLHHMMGKQAEISGTVDMPSGAPVGKSPPISSTIMVKKTATVDEVGQMIFGKHGGQAVEPETNEEMKHKEAPTKLPQSRVHVDVSNKEASVTRMVKKAELYAVPSLEKFPLDSYVDVQRASEYFDKYASQMEPALKREYCTNLVKRASSLGIPVSETARRYGASTYAPEEELKVAYQLRRRACGDIQDLANTLDQLFDKHASIEPELFAQTLVEFDKVAGIDSKYGTEVPDPYYSTFGEKTAEFWNEVIGNDVVTKEDLVRLSKVGMRALKSTFSEDFAMEFKKNPVDIFKSLPLDQKKIVMRMATDNSGPGIELTS